MLIRVQKAKARGLPSLSPCLRRNNSVGGLWEVYGRCMGGVRATPPMPQTLCTSMFQPHHGRCCLFSPKCHRHFAPMTAPFHPNDIVITPKSHSYFNQMTILFRPNHVFIPAKCHSRLAPSTPSIGPIEPNNRSERSRQSVRSIS